MEGALAAPLLALLPPPPLLLLLLLLLLPHPARMAVAPLLDDPEGPQGQGNLLGRAQP